MDFGLSEEQDMLQETIRGFAQNECPTTRLRELFDAGAADPFCLRAGMKVRFVPISHGDFEAKVVR